jgi:hypothetical protein
LHDNRDEIPLLNGTAGTTGVVQAPFNGITNSFTFAVPAHTQATALYMLINTAYGEAGVNEGSVVVTGTAGETATLDLTEGDNIRDQNQDGYTNTLTDPTVVSTYFVDQTPNSTNGPVRLDRQVLELPTSFQGDTIASIEFNGVGDGDPDGSPFLAALTLANGTVTSTTVPLPPAAWSALAMLGGLAILQFIRARRRLALNA